MRYLLVLLAGSIAWTAPAFAESGSDSGLSMFSEFATGKLQLAPKPPSAAPSAAAPAPQSPGSFKYKGESQAEFEERERRCLSTAIYWEARDRPIQTQAGVGQVILNRVRSPQFPQTICGVVYQGQMAPDCQFPFACDGRSDTPQDGDQWALAQKLARQITAGEVWLPELGYALSLETALAIGTSSGSNWADCGSSDVDRSLAACNAFIADSKGGSPDLTRAYSRRGDAYYSKGEYDRAIADFDRVIRLAPDVYAYNLRGAAFIEKGEYDRALADFDQAIRLKPDDADAHFRRGVAYYRKSNYDRAIADYDQAIKLNPNSITYTNRGVAYEQKRDHDRAIADFDQAIRLQPDNTLALNARGSAYSSKGNYDRALADLDQAIRLDPRFSKAYANRGESYAARGDYDRAIADYDQAIRLQPGIASTYSRLGLAYTATGDRQRAISAFHTALSITSSDPINDKWAHDTAKQKLAERETVQPQLPLDQGKRIALVIGNSQYRNIPRLDNPANDAKLMASTLKSLGFKLIGDGPQLDLDKPAFDNAVQRFGNGLQDADVGLFYFAGHGVQMRGSNYLVPISANPTKEADADFQMLDAALVLRQMEGSGTKLNIVMLDACRNNPFGGRGIRSSAGGLAQMQVPEGTIISYATQPGNIAQDGNDGDSPYTKALAQVIRRPGLDVFQTFNQVGIAVKRATDGLQQPWVSNSPIEGDFYFAGK